MHLNRRELIAALSALGLAPSAFARDDEPSFTFAHGVASGDPQRDRVILWTRVTPVDPTETLRVRWTVASDPRMKQIRQSGRFVTDRRRDFTVKVDATGLNPGLTYYYQFEARGVKSPIGRTRTLPVGRVDRLRLAFASCANYPHGYFNAYARIAERDDLDFVLHLGDYLYEYKLGVYADAAARRPARRRADARDRGAERLSPALCAVSQRSRSAGSPSPASVHHGVGRSRDRQQFLARRRGESQP